MGRHEGRGEWLGRAGAATAIVIVLATVAACGNSRDSSQGEETVPRITPTSSATTTTTTTTVEVSTTTVAPTSPPTAQPPTPFPTPVTAPPTAPPFQPPQTAPPTAPPTQPPQTAPPTAPPTQPPQTAPPTQPPTTPAPITLPPTTPAPPTTVVVTAGDPALCTDAAVGAATGLLTITDVSCHAGWAIGLDVTCPATQACEGLDVFHVTSSGWVHDGYFPAMCAEALAASGMSIYTAASFVGAFCGDPPGATEIIRPDATGDRVVHLQTALIAQGYPIAADGTYGPRTEAAVRDYQSRHGLEVDGIAGPQTQASLEIGPGGQPSAGNQTTTPTMTTTTMTTTTMTTTTMTTTTMTTTTTPSTTEPASTTTVVGAGEPVPCTAARIGADIGREVAEVTACHAGFALGQIRACPANSACPRADLFRLSETGWAFIRSVRYQCAEDLHQAGMSAYTAAEFVSWCGVPNLPEQRLVIEPGTTGIIVEQLQVALVALGYNIAVDGTYGPGTEQAVRDVQSRNGLEVDGIAGPATRELLGL